MGVGTGKVRTSFTPGPPVTTPLRTKKLPFVFDLAFHPTEPLLATACGDPMVRLWDGTTGVPRGEFDWGIGNITAVGFSPDGNLCAAAGALGRVAVWDAGG